MSPRQGIVQRRHRVRSTVVSKKEGEKGRGTAGQTRGASPWIFGRRQGQKGQHGLGPVKPRGFGEELVCSNGNREPLKDLEQRNDPI